MVSTLLNTPLTIELGVSGGDILIEVDVEIYFSFKDKIPGGKGELSLRLPEGSRVLDALEKLIVQYPELDGEIFESSGKLRRFIQVRLNQQGVEHLSGLETEITGGDELLILPKLGGG